MSSSTDPYEVLMVPRGASAQEIRTAFKTLIGQWHPDVTASPEAHHRSAMIIQAYRALSQSERLQPERRSRPDRRRHDPAVAISSARERRRGERRGRPSQLPRAWRVTMLAWSVATGLTVASAVAAELPYGATDPIEWGGPS